MARAISAICCLIVGLQILVGVPLLVCIVFFVLADDDNGQFAVELHAGPDSPPQHVAIAPPPNIIPSTPSPALDNPVLQTRAEHGSPLAGTILSEGESLVDEQSLFFAALEKVAAENSVHQVPALPASSSSASAVPTTTQSHADLFTVEHLYAMANVDEGAENYDRADQWRAFAREIRRNSKPAESTILPAGDALSEAFDPARSTH